MSWPQGDFYLQPLDSYQMYLLTYWARYLLSHIVEYWLIYGYMNKFTHQIKSATPKKPFTFNRETLDTALSICKFIKYKKDTKTNKIDHNWVYLSQRGWGFFLLSNLLRMFEERTFELYFMFQGSFAGYEPRDLPRANFFLEGESHEPEINPSIWVLCM